MTTPTILEKIKAYKLDEIEAAKRAVPLAEIESQARTASPVRPFTDALFHASKHDYGLIAEIKKASPSKGLIREDFNVPELAQAYETGGATCLSVLTDAPSFQGASEFLGAARSACNLPVLRKDFMYDTYQVAEARAWGADCILIIMASVSDAQATELEDAAIAWGMDALLEVHDQPELERAVALKSKMIGINNRDLNTFETTLDTTRTLSRMSPEDRMVSCESGRNTAAELADMERYGARCFLIGESLMRQNDVTQATKSILSKATVSGAVGL